MNEFVSPLFPASLCQALQDRATSSLGQSLIARQHVLLDQPIRAIDQGFHAAGQALLATLTESETEQKQRAECARVLVERVLSDDLLHSHENGPIDPVPLWEPTYKAILQTDPAVGLALAYAIAGKHWPSDFREHVAHELAWKSHFFIEGGGVGWNPFPASNWHANTRSAAGILALALLDHPEHGDQARQTLDEAIQGIQNYLSAQSGDRGWTQEGFHYYRYPLCHHLLPFVALLRQTVLPDAFVGSAIDWMGLLYPQLLLPKPTRGSVPIVNGDSRYEWNHFRSGDLLFGLLTTPAEKRGAIRWLFDQWFGTTEQGGDETFDMFLPHHLLFALLALGEEIRPANPAQVLRRNWVDRKKGLVISRDRWRDGDDCVLCVDANTQPSAGTGKPTCTAGFRLFGLGEQWACYGPGVDDGNWKRQRVSHNVAQPVVSAAMGDDKAAGRWLSLDAGGSDRLSLALDLSAVYGQPATRRFDCLWRVDFAAGLVMVVDEFEPGVSFDWVLHTAGLPLPTQQGFRIQARNGALLEAVTIAGAIEDFRVKPCTVEYPAGPEDRPTMMRFNTIHIRARHQLGFALAMTRDRLPEAIWQQESDRRNLKWCGQLIDTSRLLAGACASI